MYVKRRFFALIVVAFAGFFVGSTYYSFWAPKGEHLVCESRSSTAVLPKGTTGKNLDHARTGGSEDGRGPGSGGPMSSKGTVMIVHERVPLFDSRGSDLRILTVTAAFRRANFDVVFVGRMNYTEVTAMHYGVLQDMGVDIISPFSKMAVRRYVMNREITAVFVMTWFWNWPKIPTALDQLEPIFRPLSPEVPIVLISDDVHYLRESMLPNKQERAESLRIVEKSLYNRGDAILTITHDDGQLIHDLMQPVAPIGLLPFVVSDAELEPRSIPGYEARKDLIFVGGPNHVNNIGIAWFVESVLPKVTAKIPGVNLNIYGKVKCPVAASETTNVHCLGFIDDLALVLDRARVFVSPITSGTGVNTKNVKAMVNGLPLVTTEIGAQGLRAHQSDSIIVQDDPQAMADAIVALYSDKGNWQSHSKALLVHCKQYFGEERLDAAVEKVMQWVSAGGRLPGLIDDSTSRTHGAENWPVKNLPKDLKVALHAQKLSDSGVIMGSEITTHYLAEAMKRRPEITFVQRYGPSAHKDIATNPVDLVVVEGWRDDVPEFLAKARAANPKVIVIHWCLSLWNIDEVLRFDVDGFVTNTPSIYNLLSKVAPTRHVLIGAPTPNDIAAELQGGMTYNHNVTFLGSARFDEKSFQYQMLKEARPFGLAVYGKGWKETEFADCWQGLLPRGDILRLYKGSKVVLGVTVDSQRAMGMINNRVFDVLAIGGVMISDYFDELFDLAGNSILYHREQGDTTRHLKTLFEYGAYGYGPNPLTVAKLQDKALRAAAHNSYDQRASLVLDFAFNELAQKPRRKPEDINWPDVLQTLSGLRDTIISPLQCNSELALSAIKDVERFRYITENHLKSAITKHKNLIRFQIVNNEVYTVGFDEKWCNRDDKVIKKCEYGFRSRLSGMQSILLRLSRLAKLGLATLPNMDFVVNMESKPLNSRDTDLLPIFSVWKTEQHSDFLFVDEAFALFDFVNQRPSFSKSGLAERISDDSDERFSLEYIRKYARLGLRHPVRWEFSASDYLTTPARWIWEPAPEELPPFEDRRPVLFWRGSPTGGHFEEDNWRTFPRSQLVLQSTKHSDVMDCAFVDWGPQVNEPTKVLMSREMQIQPKATLMEHAKYELLLDIDGNAAANRFHKIIFLDSMIIKMPSAYYGHYYYELQPYRQYVPLVDGLEKLPSLVNDVHSTRTLISEVRLQARVFRETHLSLHAIDCYLLQLLDAYSKKLTWDITIHPDAIHLEA